MPNKSKSAVLRRTWFPKNNRYRGRILPDGKDLIQINPKRTARSGIVLIKNSWIKEVATLIKETNVLKNTYFSSTFRALWYLDLPQRVRKLQNR